jgi:hypothetical protein
MGNQVIEQTPVIAHLGCPEYRKPPMDGLDWAMALNEMKNDGANFTN